MEPIPEDSIVRINVGGIRFQCYRKALNTFPDSKLASIEKLATECYRNDSNEFFFDRNPLLFAFILDGYRKGLLHLPKDHCGITYKEELEFWNLSARWVAPCCWETLYKCDSDVETMKQLLISFKRTNEKMLVKEGSDDLKTRLWQFLEIPNSSKHAMVWSMFISAIILASTLMQALASLPSFQVEPSEVEKETLKRYTKWYNMPFGLTKPHPSILYADFCCHVILSIEFIVEFVVCPNRRSFMLSPVRIIVFVSYVSYWIDIMLELNLDKLANSHALNVYVVFKYMTILMLGRLFYITKQVPAFKILGLTFRSSKQELKILVFMLGVLVFGFGYTLFITELLQESEINNVFVAMYWALITLTTVGYGRYVPTSVLGHVVAGACALCGVLVLALPIGVIASAFYTFYYNHKYASKHLALAF